MSVKELHQVHIHRDSHLWLEETALQQNQCLPFVLVNQFPKAHAEVLIPVHLVVEQTLDFLVRQALLKSTEDLDVGELALGKPGLSHDTQAFAKHAKELGAIGDDHNGLLDSGSCNIGRAVDELC